MKPTVSRRLAIIAVCAITFSLSFALWGCVAGATQEADSYVVESPYGSLQQFSVKTLSGDGFTQDDLAGYDLTMVNVWQTTCGPCIYEMSALQQLWESLPDNVNMITVCTDALYYEADARDIMGQTGSSYPVLIANEDLYDVFLCNVDFTPTTVFVDRSGNILGGIVGVPSTSGTEDVVQKYQELIEEYLQAAQDNYQQAA